MPNRFPACKSSFFALMLASALLPAAQAQGTPGSGAHVVTARKPTQAEVKARLERVMKELNELGAVIKVTDNSVACACVGPHPQPYKEVLIPARTYSADAMERSLKALALIEANGNAGKPTAVVAMPAAGKEAGK